MLLFDIESIVRSGDVGETSAAFVYISRISSSFCLENERKKENFHLELHKRKDEPSSRSEIKLSFGRWRRNRFVKTGILRVGFIENSRRLTFVHFVETDRSRYGDLFTVVNLSHRFQSRTERKKFDRFVSVKK